MWILGITQTVAGVAGWHGKMFSPVRGETRITHKKVGHEGARYPARWEQIIGIDGEGISDNDTDAQRYTLLAASSGESIESHNLGSERIFDYLLSLPKRSLLVGYSIGYDINMWLRDLPLDQLTELWEDGRTEWRGYWLVWQPGKMFSIGRERGVKPYMHNGVKRKRIKFAEHVTIWDVFGFFQSSFVRALEEWQIGTETERERIASMKSKRSDFTPEEKTQIREYCYDEVRLLAVMVRKLIDYAISVGLKLTRYDGAGAIASAIMRKFKVADHIAVPPEPVHNAALYAYFGGRFETAMIGHIAKAYSYDIRSAYPAITQRLPCLAHGTWSQSVKPHKYGVYRVEWNVEQLIPRWGPFPFRTEAGAIVYPMSGEGWYWGDEVMAAQHLFPRRIKILEGHVYSPSCGHRPFDFIPAFYKLRAELKAKDNFGQIILKLGMNSLYGKCAQSVGGAILGYGVDGKVIHDRPRYQSFVWAGMITSGTRAKILDAISLNPSAVISIATDGIISTEPLALECGDQLGQWEYKEITALTIVQNGVYRYICEGQEHVRARGFAGREFDFDALAVAFARDGERAEHRTAVKRFIGLGSSLAARPQLKDWRRWMMVPKTVRLRPTNRLLISEIDTVGGISEIDTVGGRAAFPRPPRTRAKTIIATVAWHGMLGAGISHPYRLRTNFAHLFSDELTEQREQPDPA